MKDLKSLPEYFEVPVVIITVNNVYEEEDETISLYF